MSIDFYQLARERFDSLPMPSRKDEHWRFADLKFWGSDIVKLLSMPTLESLGLQAAALEALAENPFALRFFDSLINGGKFDAYAALNFGAANIVRVPAGEHMKLSGRFDSRINIFVIEKNASLEICRSEEFFDCEFFAEANCFFLQNGAKLNLNTFFFGNNSPHYSRSDFYLQDYAEANDVFVDIGNSMARTERNAFLQGLSSRAEISALFRCTNENTHDIRTSQIHSSPNAHSNLKVKNILSDASRCAFAGLIKVEETAQKTEAYQSCRSLLMSPKARVQAIPVLEIMANDVSCSHGCAVSQPDEDMLFYMKSRGLDSGDAEKLLLSGFANEIVEKYSSDHFANIVRAHL